jgi:similar to stage IV sporulation protein
LRGEVCLFLINFWKYIIGYAIICVEGYFIERFINLCSTRNIKLWDIKRNSENYLIAKIEAGKFKYLKRIVRISRCRIKIKKKIGLPFVLKRYKKRKTFIIFLVLMIFFINFFTSFIWKIEVIGNFSIPIEEIYQSLENSGLRLGEYKNKLDLEEVKRKVELSRNDITWIGIELKGIKATVEIVQKIEKPVMIEKDEPCNIISDKEGIIAKILIREGMQLVKENDIVSKGQILISGIITSKFSPDRFVHADGEIYIKTWYTQKMKIPYEKDLVNLTGDEAKDFKIKILNYEINLSNSSTKFEKYDKISETNKLKVLDLFELPIEVKTDTYKKINIETIKYNESQAESIAINEAMNGALKKIPKSSEIINNKVNVLKNEEGVEAEVTIECIEKVGTKEKLGG